MPQFRHHRKARTGNGLGGAFGVLRGAGQIVRAAQDMHGCLCRIDAAKLSFERIVPRIEAEVTTEDARP